MAAMSCLLATIRGWRLWLGLNNVINLLHDFGCQLLDDLNCPQVVFKLQQHHTDSAGSTVCSGELAWSSMDIMHSTQSHLPSLTVPLANGSRA